MSRSYAILGAALLGLAGLGAIAQATSGDASGTEGSEAEVEAARSVRDQVVSEVADGQLDTTPAATIDPDCTLSVRLEPGDRHVEVACLESQLIAAGLLVDATADDVFDDTTAAAVRAFQARNGITVDGVVGPQTASEIGTWVGPDVLPDALPDRGACSESGRSAVVDRVNQRAWLCESGDVTDVMPMTSARSQPDPGTYEVYAKDLEASSTITGRYSEMTHFVAFTYGEYQGARIAFHSVPTYADGEYVQPLDSVGTAELHGDSSGCIRVLPDDAERIWDWLDIGDSVTVVT